MVMSLSWSQQIAERYDLVVPEDIRHWLDDEVWKSVGEDASYRPLHPEEWMHPGPGVVWGGFMLPDTLPVVGNQYGDWLCLRWGADGSLREVVYWSHAGGDWIPFGQSLSEALLFDVANIYRGPQEADWLHAQPPCTASRRAAAWAAAWFTVPGQPPLPHFWEDAKVDAWSFCEAAGVGRIALRRQQVLQALDNPLRRASNPHLARQLGYVWEPDFVRWIFDTQLMPVEVQQRVSAHFQRPFEEVAGQDWERAEALSLEVLQERQDLAWAAEIAGWAAERRGDQDQAIDRYLLGSQGSLFSDDCVSFRSHWYDEGFGKFSLARLYHHRDQLDAATRSSPYLRLFWQNDPESLRARVRDYWMRRAEDHESHGRYAEAYQTLYQAGWDLGLQFVKGYGDILDRMARVAQRARCTSLAKLARLHRQSLLGN